MKLRIYFNDYYRYRIKAIINVFEFNAIYYRYIIRKNGIGIRKSILGLIEDYKNIIYLISHT